MGKHESCRRAPSLDALGRVFVAETSNFFVPGALAFFGLAWMMACGATSDRSSGLEATGTTASALSGPVTYNISVTLPTGTSIVDTTLGSSGAIAIGPNDRVLGPTASAAGTVEVGGFATSVALTASANVQVDAAATVNGNVVAGGSVVVLPTGHINGTQTAFSSTPTPYTTTWSVTSPATSQGPIFLASNAIASPTPGAYDSVVVNTGSSLYLHSGTYFFQSLDLEPGANLYVDQSHGPVFLYVTSTLKFRGNEKSLDAGVPRLFLVFLGTCPLVEVEAPFKGVFLAPNALLVHLEDPLWILDPVKGPLGNTATFYGNSIIADPGEVFNPASFDWSSVPGFPIPPGGWAANGGTMGNGVTGGGGGKVTAGTLPPSAVNLHVSSQTSDPVQANGPGVPQSTNSTATPTSQVPFHLPGSFDVGGVLANGTATITYTSCTGTVVTCTYQGGSSSASPTTLLDLEAGRTATFASCSDGQPATALRCGTSFSLSTQPASGWPVSIDLSLDDRACTAKADILTPYKTRQMLESFHWPDPSKPPPLVAEMASDGKTLNLYYGYVYLHNTADLLRLRQLYIHYLTRPLYNSEFEPYAGQCVQFQNPGDGVGIFAPVLIPGKVYNIILNGQNTAFQQKNNIQPGDPLFKAVILRSTTPVDFAKLRASGFRYLDYEGGPTAQSAMKLSGGAASVVLQDFLTFALSTVQDVQNAVTSALGDLDALFAGRINYNMTINVGNSGTSFANPYATRGWGKLAGQPLGAASLKVTAFLNLFGVIPEQFSGYTDDGGFTSISVAKHSSSDIGGAGFCVTLQNDAAWATSYLLPNDVCNLQGFDRLAVGLATSVSTNPINVPDFSQNQQFSVVMSNPQLSAVYGMTDAYKYMVDVAGGYHTATAHALVGDGANVIGSFHGGTAFTHALHLRNESDANLFTLLTPYINNFGEATELDQLSTGGQLVVSTVLTPLSLGASWLISNFANTDIILPDSSIDDSGTHGHREVGTHEFGHFILMNLIHDTNNNAIDDLIGDMVQPSGVGNNKNYPARYVNEAFADYISGQVTGIANYYWLGGGQGDNGKVCISSPCFDKNFAMPVSTTDTGDGEGIARVASLIHDAFDGQSTESVRNQDQPDNADPWSLTTTAASEPPYTFAAVSWGDADGPDSHIGLVPACRIGTGPQLVTVTGTTTPACIASESVAMPGSRLVEFGHLLPTFHNGNPYFTDHMVAQALDKTMVDAGYNWCQRCQVLALHVSENSSDKLDPISLLKLCYRGDGSTDEFGQFHSDEDPDLLSWQLPSVPSGTTPPDRHVRLDASTCKTCPAGKYPDGNGRCTVDCPADFTISGTTAPFTPATITETGASGLAPGSDPCPGLFILEIDNPDQYFARGATSVTGAISIDSVTQQSCEQSFTESWSDFPATSTTGYSTEATDTSTGSFQSSSSSGLVFNPCTNTPSISLTSSSLVHGSAPIRFSTP